MVIEMLNRNVQCYNGYRNAQQKMVIGMLNRKWLQECSTEMYSVIMVTGMLNRNVQCYNGYRNAPQKCTVL